MKTSTLSKDDIKPLVELFEILLEWDIEAKHLLKMKLAKYLIFNVESIHQLSSFQIKVLKN